MFSISNQRQTQGSSQYKQKQEDSGKGGSSTSSQTKRQSPFSAQSAPMTFKGFQQTGNHFTGGQTQGSGKTETSGDTASGGTSGFSGCHNSGSHGGASGSSSQAGAASSGGKDTNQASEDSGKTSLGGKGNSSSSDTASASQDTGSASGESTESTKDSSSSAETTGTSATTAATGETVVVNEPIVVDGGVFDGEGKTYTASSALGDGGQSEDQKPVFILKNGATLKNVTIGDNGADGIHVYGGATLENVNWKDVGEDALTVKSAGDVNIIGGSAANASDKIFQVNADTNLTITDFKADGFTTLVRTNGGKQIDANVTINGGDFSNGTVLFRTDSDSASVNFTGDITASNVEYRTRYKDQKEAYS